MRPPRTGSPDLTLYTDGASRGNPGPAGLGVVLIDAQGREVLKLSESLGHMTNNQAEYWALIRGLEEALRLKPRWLEVRLDSELLARQLEGRYRVKHPRLQPLYQRAKGLLARFPAVTVGHLPREGNQEADRLAAAAARKG